MQMDMPGMHSPIGMGVGVGSVVVRSVLVEVRTSMVSAVVGSLTVDVNSGIDISSTVLTNSRAVEMVGVDTTSGMEVGVSLMVVVTLSTEEMHGGAVNLGSWLPVRVHSSQQLLFISACALRFNEGGLKGDESWQRPTMKIRSALERILTMHLLPKSRTTFIRSIEAFDLRTIPLRRSGINDHSKGSENQINELHLVDDLPKKPKE
jgi:hypothetical protein